jgi:protein-S-isoprenylcysteine O-methyltransferase Ste14
MALIEEFEKQGNWLFRYRGILPMIILLIGGGVFAYTEMFPDYFYIKSSPLKNYYELFCLFVSFYGLLIRVYTVGHTPRNTSGRNVKGQLADTLNTSGIYSIVRHPLYFGNFFMWLGPALLIGHPWFVVAFCLFYWIYYERIMFAEEQFLRRKFGDAYTNWAENVPAFFPKFKNFTKPNISFSFKKVLKKEKNGLVAIFLIFAAFNFAGEHIGEQYGYNFPLYIATGISVVFYFVLKFLKKQTSILNEEGR